MEIKTKNLYFITIGTISSSNYKKNCEIITSGETFALANAKYYLFKKGKIKYFVNVLDKTKYYPKEREETGICAVHYLPASTILTPEEISKKKISYNKISHYFSKYKRLVDKITNVSKAEKENDNDKESTPKSNLREELNLGKTLTNKYFKNDPAIGRENELEEVITPLATLYRNPILVGKSGVGKTSIAEKLAYNIQRNNVPEFLKNRKIIEVSSCELVAGTKYLGELEKKVLSLINYVKEHNAILFIDEIHTIYGAGTSEKNDNDVASIIKTAIDRDGIKVIGTTTTEEYNKYFTNNALKRRFEVVEIKEPTGILLRQIINYTFDNYSKNYGISIDNLYNNVVDILIELTEEKHRTYNDKICNPDLTISIIDKSFALALVENSKTLEIRHIIKAIKTCTRVYDSARINAINKISALNPPGERKTNIRVLKIH